MIRVERDTLGLRAVQAFPILIGRLAGDYLDGSWADFHRGTGWDW